MQNTITNKILMMILMGFCAACLLYVYRHIINQAIHESGDGWKDMYKDAPAKKVR